MASVKELRLRITSVGNIQQITRAMEMVATTKLRRFQDRAIASRPYTEEIAGLVSHLAGVLGDDIEGNPLFKRGEGSKTAVLLVSSDRGLCGAYNSNIQRQLESGLEGLPPGSKLFVIGKKSMEHAARMGHDVFAYFDDFDPEKMHFSKATEISQQVATAFLEEGLSAIFLCGTRFLSMVRYEPYFESFLPIAPSEGEILSEPLLEPSGPELLERLVPSYLETLVFHALGEAITSEYASRRFAMKNATDAAGDMKKEITRTYNRARQQKITSEITEIVSGAEAL